MISKDRPFQDGRLVRESEWLRVYSVGAEQLHYESKFVQDKLQVSLASIESRWDSFSEEEKSDFLMAFQSKYPLTGEDEGILEFLTKVKDEDVWSTIALPLTRMSSSKHDRVLSFLIERIQHRGTHRANYYQALATLKNRMAVPALKAAFEEERISVSLDKPLGTFRDIFAYVDYLACCAALYKLDGSEQFKQAIDDMKSHPDAAVRIQAETALRSS
jgi:hypothetical protein